ncbi:MAG: hypothetical protein LIO95_10105 [Clostridiales bacterium]|nr:hypothetical protein [Clostridiales bacterium]
MTTVEKLIMDTLLKTLPKLTDQEKSNLLAFAEGMAFKASQVGNRDSTNQ